jgi:hypothetical protein
MIERLVETLQALAAPAEVQLARHPEIVARSEELALDFADALRLVTDCPQIHLTRAQRESLEQLDAYLEQRGDGARDAFWTEQAIRTSAEWAEVRRLAASALGELDEPRHP